MITKKRRGAPCQLLALKERFGPEIVRVEDAELLEAVIQNQGWTGEAEILARKLFATV